MSRQINYNTYSGIDLTAMMDEIDLTLDPPVIRDPRYPRRNNMSEAPEELPNGAFFTPRPQAGPDPLNSPTERARRSARAVEERARTDRQRAIDAQRNALGDIAAQAARQQPNHTAYINMLRQMVEQGIIDQSTIRQMMGILGDLDQATRPSSNPSSRPPSPESEVLSHSEIDNLLNAVDQGIENVEPGRAEEAHEAISRVGEAARRGGIFDQAVRNLRENRERVVASGVAHLGPNPYSSGLGGVGANAAEHSYLDNLDYDTVRNAIDNNSTMKKLIAEQHVEIVSMRKRIEELERILKVNPPNVTNSARKENTNSFKLHRTSNGESD